jgi:hypothetical protein
VGETIKHRQFFWETSVDKKELGGGGVCMRMILKDVLKMQLFTCCRIDKTFISSWVAISCLKSLRPWS